MLPTTNGPFPSNLEANLDSFPSFRLFGLCEFKVLCYYQYDVVINKSAPSECGDENPSIDLTNSYHQLIKGGTVPCSSPLFSLYFLENVHLFALLE